MSPSESGAYLPSWSWLVTVPVSTASTMPFVTPSSFESRASCSPVIAEIPSAGMWETFIFSVPEAPRTLQSSSTSSPPPAPPASGSRPWEDMKDVP